MPKVVTSPTRGGSRDGADEAVDLTLPPGATLTVTTDDGATLAVTVVNDFPGRADIPTAVFVHGWTNTRSVWAPVVRRVVAAGHRVVLYDQRGHGASTLGADPMAIERLGDDMALVFDHLDLRDAVLVGHSMGGFAGLAYACRHHDDMAARLRGLALVSTAAHGLGLGRLGPLAVRLAASPMVGRVLGRPRAGLVPIRGVFGRRPSRAQLVATRAMFLATAPEVRQGYLSVIGLMDLRSCLAGIEVPTVVMVGTRDTLTPPRLSHVLAEMIPGARLDVLPEAGHMLPFERPDEVARTVLSLLDA